MARAEPSAPQGAQGCADTPPAHRSAAAGVRAEAPRRASFECNRAQLLESANPGLCEVLKAHLRQRVTPHKLSTSSSTSTARAARPARPPACRHCSGLKQRPSASARRLKRLAQPEDRHLQPIRRARPIRPPHRIDQLETARLQSNTRNAINVSCLRPASGNSRQPHPRASAARRWRSRPLRPTIPLSQLGI